MDVRSEIQQTIHDLCKAIQRNCDHIGGNKELPQLVQATAQLIQSSEKFI